jgi:hypothetical protein
MRRAVGSAALAVLGVLTPAVVVTASGTATTAGTSPPATVDTTPGAAAVDPDVLRSTMRELWSDHVVWTRLYILSAIADLPDLDATAGRLLQNQDDIGEAITAYYGAETGDGLTALLRDHILIAADLVGAAIAADDAAVTTASARWYANADEIADFLAAANPAWSQPAMRDMMRMHLDQTVAEVTARLNGDWAGDIAAFDLIEQHILELADALTAGIVTQFPGRFTGPA